MNFDRVLKRGSENAIIFSGSSAAMSKRKRGEVSVQDHSTLALLAGIPELKNPRRDGRGRRGGVSVGGLGGAAFANSLATMMQSNLPKVVEAALDEVEAGAGTTGRDLGAERAGSSGVGMDGGGTAAAVAAAETAAGRAVEALTACAGPAGELTARAEPAGAPDANRSRPEALTACAGPAGADIERPTCMPLSPPIRVSPDRDTEPSPAAARRRHASLIATECAT